MSTIDQTAQYIVTSILPENAGVSVNTRDDNGTLIITVTALPEFIGQLIGKEGKVIKSLRTLLNLAYPDVRYMLEIKE
jgi:predicted RNA-binding protein YlqC (UPF0109 family)